MKCNDIKDFLDMPWEAQRGAMRHVEINMLNVGCIMEAQAMSTTWMMTAEPRLCEPAYEL